MKMFKVYGMRFDDEGKLVDTHIFIAGASKMDVKYQINKYGLIALDPSKKHQFQEIYLGIEEDKEMKKTVERFTQ